MERMALAEQRLFSCVFVYFVVTPTGEFLSGFLLARRSRRTIPNVSKISPAAVATVDGSGTAVIFKVQLSI